jgi:hypothetical protein
VVGRAWGNSITNLVNRSRAQRQGGR